MRRGWIGLCCLVALGAAAAFAADDAKEPGTGPSLEYRPPKPLLPEPKGATPAPPVTIFRDSFGRFGISRGSFDNPVDVAIGDGGRTYVLDAGNGRIQLFNKSKDFLAEWGSYGSDEARCQFKDPSRIIVVRDESGAVQKVPCARGMCEMVFLSDTGNNRFYWFKVPLDDKDLTNLPCGHGDSNFVTDPLRSAEVSVASGYTFGVFGKKGIREGRFDRPLDIEVASVDVRGGIGLGMLALDAGNRRIQLCALPADTPESYACTDILSDLTGSRGNLEGLVSFSVSHEGSFDYIYTLGAGCAIQKFKFTMNVSMPVLDETWPGVAPESELCVPAQVRYDSKSWNVYVLDSGNSLLSVFHRNGNYISALRGADRSFSAPGGFDFISQTGEFAVADTGNDLVQKFTLR